jgi:hypothetical protein
MRRRVGNVKMMVITRDAPGEAGPGAVRCATARPTPTSPARYRTEP